MRERVGVAGLGNMGGGMARRLLSCGYAVAGFDPVAAANDAFAAAGGSVVPSAAELAATVPVIVASLPDPASVRALFLGERGILSAAPRGLTVIDTSTIDPLTIADIASACAERGVHLIDATVSGQPVQAAAGELVFMIGAPDALLAAHRPLLEKLSKDIHHTGDVGTAKTVKLINNLMSLGNIAVAAEAFTLGLRCGMDPKKLFDVLSTSGGRSAHFNHDFPRVIEGDFRPGFKTALALKDIRLILDLAGKETYAVALAPVLESLYAAAVDGGYGDEHFAAVIKLYQSGTVPTAPEHART